MGGNGERGTGVTIMKNTVQEIELDFEFNEIACISDFRMLTLASETSIYARTAEINCYYLMTLCFCGTQFKRAEVKQNFGNFPVNLPILLGPFQNGFTRVFSMYVFGMSLILHHTR